MQKAITLFWACSCVILVSGQSERGKINPLKFSSMDSSSVAGQMLSAVTHSRTTIYSKLDTRKSTSPGYNWDKITTFDLVGNDNQYFQMFDKDGHVLTRLIQYWRTNEWVKDTRDSYTYDATGNMLVYLSEKWYDFWLGINRRTFTYDSGGNPVTELAERGRGTTWENSWRDAYTYDDHGNMLTAAEESWENNAWVNSGRYTFTWDENGNLICVVGESWESEAWVNSWRIVEVYDDVGFVQNMFSEMWADGSWSIMNRQTMTHDKDGNVLTQFDEQVVDSVWVNGSKLVCTYDAGGNILTRTEETWDSIAWQPRWKYIYAYDDMGDELTETTQAWENGVWADYWKKSYDYDANGNSTTGKIEHWAGDSWQPYQYGGLDLYIAKASAYYLTGHRYEASFTSFNTGISLIPASNRRLSVFPNPASGKITVEYPAFNGIEDAKLFLYNIQGQCVVQLPVNQAETEIDTGILPKGLYLLRCSYGKRAEVVKLVIE